MSYPCANISEEYKGVRFYRDSTDESLWHYGPVRGQWKWERNVIGERVTIWTATRDLIPDSVILREFSDAHGNSKLMAVVASAVTCEPQLQVKIAAPHTATIRVIPGMPFPTIALSLTLAMSALDYTRLDAEVSQALKGDKLLSGKYRGSVEFQGFAFKGRLTRDYRAAARSVQSAVRGRSASDFEYRAAVGEAVRQLFGSLFTVEVGRVTPNDEAAIRAYLFDDFSKALLASISESKRFDQGLPVNVAVVRDPEEFAPAPGSIFVSSSTIAPYDCEADLGS
jgi:hypothetical protein